MSQSIYFNGRKRLSCSKYEQKYCAFIHLFNSLGKSWNSACLNCNNILMYRALIFLYREFLKNSNDKPKNIGNNLLR